mgnify:CR=1
MQAAKVAGVRIDFISILLKNSAQRQAKNKQIASYKFPKINTLRKKTKKKKTKFKKV